MTVHDFLGCLAQQSVWHYELEFQNVIDKHTAHVRSIVPKVHNGKVLLKIIGNQYRDKNGKVCEVTI